jgi:hypothetical protein
MHPLQAHCHLGFAKLYGKSGRYDEARVELTVAIALYRAMDMTFWLPQAEAALAQGEGPGATRGGARARGGLGLAAGRLAGGRGRLAPGVPPAGRRGVPGPAGAAAPGGGRQALPKARRQQAPCGKRRAAPRRSRVGPPQGRRAEARQLLAPSYGGCTEGVDTADLQGAKALREERARSRRPMGLWHGLAAALMLGVNRLQRCDTTEVRGRLPSLFQPGFRAMPPGGNHPRSSCAERSSICSPSSRQRPCGSPRSRHADRPSSADPPQEKPTARSGRQNPLGIARHRCHTRDLDGRP